MRRALVLTVLLSHALTMVGCGLVQGLRRDAYEDEWSDLQDQKISYRDAKKKRIPPPVTVLDQHMTAVEGTPVDLSGVRARSGRVTRADFDALNSKNENSLWKEDGQSNYFFAVNQAKLPGDLVTIEVEQGLKTEMINEFKKIMSSDDIEKGADIPELGPVGPKPVNVASAVNKTPPPAPAADNSTAAVDGAERAPASEVTAQPVTMVGEVLQRFPNGNVLVRGVKRIPYENKMRMIEVTAIVKGSDIQENNSVKSSRFFESRTEVYK